MACFLKSLKNQAPKTTAVDKAASNRAVKVDAALWMPLTAGPYLVPVTRWIE